MSCNPHICLDHRTMFMLEGHLLRPQNMSMNRIANPRTSLCTDMQNLLFFDGAHYHFLHSFLFMKVQHNHPCNPTFFHCFHFNCPNCVSRTFAHPHSLVSHSPAFCIYCDHLVVHTKLTHKPWHRASAPPKLALLFVNKNCLLPTSRSFT